MPDENSPHYRPESIDGVIVLHLLDPEIRTPILAASIGRDLTALVSQLGARRYLLDLTRTKYMSSTAFAMLLNVVKTVTAAGGSLKLCGMDPEVRIGADIIGLGRFVAILPDESAALDAFQSEPSP